MSGASNVAIWTGATSRASRIAFARSRSSGLGWPWVMTAVIWSRHSSRKRSSSESSAFVLITRVALFIGVGVAVISKTSSAVMCRPPPGRSVASRIR